MKKLKISKIDNYMYTLIDKENNTYEFNLEFLDIEKLPKINDYIYINDMLLNKNYKEYSTMYTFGSIKNECGRNVNNENDVDLIVVEIDDNRYYLKRLYG